MLLSRVLHVDFSFCLDFRFAVRLSENSSRWTIFRPSIRQSESIARTGQEAVAVIVIVGRVSRWCIRRSIYKRSAYLFCRGTVVVEGLFSDFPINVVPSRLTAFPLSLLVLVLPGLICCSHLGVPELLKMAIIQFFQVPGTEQIIILGTSVQT